MAKLTTQLSFKKTKNEFFDEIKQKIDNYFLTNKIKRTGNYKIYIKTVIFFLTASITYFSLLFLTMPVWASVILCALLGVAFAGIGFNVMHDAAHGSYSTKNWLNELVAYSLNVMGGNVFIWKNKHNFNHHTYTNIEGADDDIDIEPYIRTHLNQQKRWYHRYQHVYGLALYGLTYFNWIFVGDFKKYFSQKIANTQMHKMNLLEHFIFWISKAIAFSLFLVIPIIKFGFIKAILGFLIMVFVCGFILGVIFQLAHLIEDAEFPEPLENSNKMEQNWILHQIATTVNFAPKNKFVFWFTGGLNFQIVHHMFPKISHVHYPHVNHLIKETCHKYGIKYTEYPSLWRALQSHIKYLKRLGTA